MMMMMKKRTKNPMTMKSPRKGNIKIENMYDTYEYFTASSLVHNS